MINSIILSLGSNLGDRFNNLQMAINQIKVQFKIKNVSSVYESLPYGNTNQDNFLNVCLEIESSLSPVTILDRIVTIEKALGRVRIEKWGPRIIDIDIVAYNNETIDEDNLQCPHPDFANRSFVLLPLMEIDPNRLMGDKTVSEIYKMHNEKFTHLTKCDYVIV